MSTSRAYQDISAGVADLPSEARSGDWFCPELCLWDDKLTRQLRSQGRKVWWYVCCGPHHPYANFAALEAPPVDARVLGWMTRHFDVDGFLFWAVNYWGRTGHAPMPDSDTFLDWDSSIDSNSNGDGVLVYPGRDTLYPSVRLANVRDGVEDGELLKMLAAKDAAKAKVASGRLIRKTTDFSRDPALIRSARDDVMRALAPPVKNPGRNGKHFPSAAGVSLRERKIDVKAGDRWQIDWLWREICVPPTALLRPRITAYDKSGKAVFSANVGQIQQRTFKPEDLSVQCWRVYVNVEKNALEVNGKKENYAEAIDTVTLPVGTTGVVLKLVREGDVAEVKDVVINAERLQGLRPRQFAGFPEMAESSSEILTDRELDLVLSHRPLLKPKLVRSGDRTDLAVNGKRVVPRIFKTAAFNVPNRLPSVTALSRKGFNIVTVGLSLTPSADPSREATSGIWRADGTIDTQKVRMEIRRTLKRAPDAMLMLVFIIQPPPGWAEANPSEILRSYDRKFAFVRGVYRVTDYRTSLDYDWRKDELPAVSHASEKYAEDVARVLEKIFSDLETWPEGKAVIGTYLNGGTDTQWLDAFDTDLAGRPAADYSDVCARRFARWQRERKYTELEIPAPERFWDEKRAHYAEHAQTTMGSWRRFYAQASAQLRLTMAKAVKKGSKGRVLVGSYSPNGGLAGYPLIAQTCTEKLMSSPYWDFFAVVPDYVREHPDPVLSAVFDGSLVGNSKLFVSELDLRSHDVGNWGSWGSSFWREHHTDETFRRKTLTFVANAVTHGGGYHAYDMDGGMYATPAAQETWRIANRIAAHAHGEEPAGTRIALLSGERYWDNHSLASQRIVPYQLREFPRDALSRTGAAWNSYLVDDLLKNPAADLPPVVLVADATTMSREDVATLRKRYGCDGRVIIWCYRLGLFASDGEAIEQEMGLKLAPEGLASVGFADGNNADLLMRNVSGSLIALWPVWGLDHPRLTYADPDKGWLPLANFHGTNLPALSVRRHPDFTEIYSSRPGGVTPALLRNCLRAAGHRPLMEGNDISGYGSGIFYFVAQSSGERCFRLPEGKVPHKKLYGPDYRSLGDGRYSLTVRRGDIFILSTR